MVRSRSGRRLTAWSSISRSAVCSRSAPTWFWSEPSTSDSKSSLPSPSVLSGSSMLLSCLRFAAFRRYIRISFSMHRLAYVASLIFFDGSNVLTALISPIVPIEIRSSIDAVGVSNFLAIYTTSRRLCTIRRSLLSSSPRDSPSNVSASSCGVKGAGRVSGPLM